MHPPRGSPSGSSPRPSSRPPSDVPWPHHRRAPGAPRSGSRAQLERPIAHRGRAVRHVGPPAPSCNRCSPTRHCGTASPPASTVASVARSGGAARRCCRSPACRDPSSVFRAGSVIAGRSFCQIGLGRLGHADGVAEGLRHLRLAVEADDPLRRREDRLRLGKERRLARRRRRSSDGPVRAPARGAAPDLRRPAPTRRDRAGCRRPSAPDRSASPVGTDSNRCDLSLYWVIRSSSPSGAIVASSQASVACCGHVTLHEEHGARRVDAGGQQRDRHLPRALRQRGDARSRR